ncbi:MAG: PTS sugar transporter subunit IIA [Acidimicrobiia bacterium]|nr:PTS sugar transporter subunit IIA [Acidimicrobiia bacterium]NNF62925.1 PTS sugar transporter subunit IIA [Acidimicrobiia bacterium]
MTTEGNSPEILRRDAIFLDLPASSKAEAIEFVGGKLVEFGLVEESYVPAMKLREESFSTFLGNGVSLPHGTFEAKSAVKGTGIVVGQFRDGVDWGDDATAHLVIGLAAANEDHVLVLSQLAEVLQDEELCEQLWTTDNADLVYETLTAEPEE